MTWTYGNTPGAFSSYLKNNSGIIALCSSFKSGLKTCVVFANIYSRILQHVRSLMVNSTMPRSRAPLLEMVIWPNGEHRQGRIGNSEILIPISTGTTHLTNVLFLSINGRFDQIVVAGLEKNGNFGTLLKGGGGDPVRLLWVCEVSTQVTRRLG